MSILNVNQIQPVGSGQTITVSASDIAASSATVTASNFTGNVTGNINATGISTFNVITGVSTIGVTTIHVTGINDLSFPTDGPLSNRNLVINGRFRVDQRNNGSAVTLQSGYTVDRFRVHGPTANQFTVGQQTTGVRVTCAAVGEFGHFGTPLEQQDLLPYLGQKMTISFKVRGNTSISQTLEVIDTPNPTSGTAIVLDTYNYSVTTSWQTVTRTFTMPSSLSYACVYLSLVQVNSSNMSVNDWIELDEIQLEAGEKNTPFENRHYGDELSRSQRYYQITGSIGLANATTTGFSYRNFVQENVSLVVEMRDTPNPTLVSSVNTFTPSGNGLNVTTKNVILHYGSNGVTLASGEYWYGTLQLDSEL